VATAPWRLLQACRKDTKGTKKEEEEGRGRRKGQALFDDCGIPEWLDLLPLRGIMEQTKGRCVIGGFSSRQLERFWLEDHRRGIPTGIETALRRKLAITASASVLSDLRVPPANHLKGTQR